MFSASTQSLSPNLSLSDRACSGSCLDGFTYSSGLSSCVECESTSNFVPTLVTAAVCLFLLLVVGARLSGWTIPTCVLRAPLLGPIIGVALNIDEGMLKVGESSSKILIRTLQPHLDIN